MPPAGEPPYESVRTEVRRFLRDVPKMLALGAAVVLGFVGWRVIAGDPVGDVAAFGLAMFGVIAVLAPLLWLRHWRGLPEHGEVRSWLPLAGLVLAWTLLWFGIVVAALALAGALGP